MIQKNHRNKKGETKWQKRERGNARYEEECLLKVCNSPRMGVCGYDGSQIYPDEFMPDVRD